MAPRTTNTAHYYDLTDLPPDVRWREWMSRIEAVIFAASTPVPRAVLAALVGDDCPLDAVIANIRAELRARPYDLVPVAGGWQHRTRPHLAPVLRAARQAVRNAAATPALSASESLLLATIAYHQPVTRRDLERLLGCAVDASVVARLRTAGLVGPGPRSPRQGAPLTYVTTEEFLDHFGLESLADLPDFEDVQALGLADTTALDGTPAGAPTTEPVTTQLSLSPAVPQPMSGPPSTDISDALSQVVAASARVGARLHTLTPQSDAGGALGRERRDTERQRPEDKRR